jgi:hypothetical protein
MGAYKAARHGKRSNWWDVEVHTEKHAKEVRIEVRLKKLAD